MLKKEKEIEAEKMLEEQSETVRPRRGRPRKIEIDKSLENVESTEEKKQKYENIESEILYVDKQAYLLLFHY